MPKQCYDCGFNGNGWRRRWVKGTATLYVHYCPVCGSPRRLPRVGPLIE